MATGCDVGAVEAVRLFRRIMLHALRTQIATGPLLANRPALGRYLRAEMRHASEEQLRVLYLDAGSRLLRGEVVARGTVDSTPFQIRRIVARALELGAAGLIVAHNHPGGNPAPSRSDVENTGRLSNVCRALGIEVHDHLIVAHDRVSSFRSLGLLGT